MRRILINELHVKMDLPLEEANKCLLKNNNCKSILTGDMATLFYPLDQTQTITSIIKYKRQAHSSF